MVKAYRNIFILKVRSKTVFNSCTVKGGGPLCKDKM